MSKEVSKDQKDSNNDELKEIERHLLSVNPKVFEGNEASPTQGCGVSLLLEQT